MSRLVVLVLLLLLPVSAPASSINVVFATDTLDRDLCVTPPTTVSLYILALLYADAAGSGTTAAVFNVTGYEASWFTLVNANPGASLALGNPLGSGAYITFPTCQTSSAVLLYTIQSVILEEFAELTLEVVANPAFPNPSFPCPRLTLCDAPVFTSFCVEGQGAHLSTCKVGAAPASWTTVRAMYR